MERPQIERLKNSEFIIGIYGVPNTSSDYTLIHNEVLIKTIVYNIIMATALFNM